jgi:hypothetical protein
MQNRMRMHNRTHKTLAIALGLSLASTAGALAAGPLKGKTYVGSAPTEGIANYHNHPARLFSGGNIVFRVAHNGRSVTVSFSSSVPLMYCHTSEVLKVQTTKPARISSSGSFKAVIDQRFMAGEGAPGIVQTITGRFSGSKVSGRISTSVGECGGFTNFSAKAR